MVAIDGIKAGFSTMFDQWVIVHRDAKNQADAIWISMENAALHALDQILEKEIENAIIGTAVHKGAETAKTASTEEGVLERLAMVGVEIVKTLAAAAAKMVDAIASIFEWEVAAFGPAAIVTIPATVAAMLAVFNKMKSAMGFEQGGRIRKGQKGYIEGTGNEIIAPEQTFVDIARKELMPRILLEGARAIDRSIVARVSERGAPVFPTDSRDLTQTLKNVEKILREWPTKVDFVQKGDDLYGVWRPADKRYKATNA